MAAQRGCRGDERDGIEVRFSDCRQVKGKQLFGQEVGNGEKLRLQDAIQCYQSQLTFLAQEVGDVGLGESRLLREHGPGDNTAFNATNDLQAKTLMGAGKVHVWKYAYEL